METQRLEDMVGEVVCREPQFVPLAYRLSSREGSLTFKLLGRTLNPYELRYGAAIYSIGYAAFALRQLHNMNWFENNEH